MNTLPSIHPMDEIPVRALQFNLDNVQFQDPLWSQTKPEFSMFINALGVHVPYFERYLIKALSGAKKLINDEGLLSDVSHIIGQEGHHAKNFISVNRWLSKRYPEIASKDKQAKDYFAKHAKNDDMKRLLAFTAGYETFTFLGGMIVLDNHEKWFKDSDGVMTALWIWHQVEEVEHGAVAFDVYQHLYGEHEWYRKWMVLFALSHIAKETIQSYWIMAKVEGWTRNPFTAVKKVGFCLLMLSRFLKSALPVFKKDYHPRRHPMVTTKQNPIQIAWRRFERAGADVLEINHQRLAEIMNFGK
ncbi:metal-dependent hydrolase [Zhongshania arctica]|uniref:Metal-dependent hydrolase n=1 Tax=Zhongshania arctica TaxID=3238302 RepID=A0ABV3TRQ0_9GAMM